MLYSASSIVRAKVRYNNRSNVINAYRIATEYRGTLDGVVSIIIQQRSVAWGIDHLVRTKIKVETLTPGHYSKTHYTVGATNHIKQISRKSSVFYNGMRALSTANGSCIVVEIKYLNDLEGAVSTTRNFAHTIIKHSVEETLYHPGKDIV